MKVTIFLGLLYTLVCSLKVDSDKSCSRGQSCVVKDDCPKIQRLYALRASESVTNGKKKSLLQQLKSLICNQKQHGFCCDVEYTFGKVDQGSEFIFGGKETTAGEFPFTALLGAKKVTDALKSLYRYVKSIKINCRNGPDGFAAEY